MKFSANLGLLWAEVSLPEAIRHAKAAGFAAVECHWPYDVPVHAIQEALNETGLSMLGLNTRRGDIDAGEFGRSAVPGRETDARADIDEAIAYASQIGTGAIHVLAGVAQGDDAQRTFLSNLAYACRQASHHQITILIEPVNRYDIHGYFLWNTGQAADIIQELDLPNLKMMFDCYHVGRTEGQVVERFKKYRPIIGHIQFASVPNRLSPDQGELDYREVFEAIENTGWSRPLGAEYKPSGPTEASLGWMKTFGATD